MNGVKTSRAAEGFFVGLIAYVALSIVVRVLHDVFVSFLISVAPSPSVNELPAELGRLLGVTYPIIGVGTLFFMAAAYFFGAFLIGRAFAFKYEAVSRARYVVPQLLVAVVPFAFSDLINAARGDFSAVYWFMGITTKTLFDRAELNDVVIFEDYDVTGLIAPEYTPHIADWILAWTLIAGGIFFAALWYGRRFGSQAGLLKRAKLRESLFTERAGAGQ